MPRGLIAAAGLASLLLTACQTTQGTSGASNTAADGHEARLARLLDPKVPTGEGTHPVVIQVSGCSGFISLRGPSLYDQWRDRLLEQGYAVVRVDYNKARGTNSCRDGVMIKEVAADIRWAVSHVVQQSYADPSKVVVMGWSYGGGGALQYLAETAEPLPIQGVVAFYPFCADSSSQRSDRWRASVPTLILFGDRDDMASLDRCRSRLVEDERNAANLDVKTYAGAYHAFDGEGLPARMKFEEGTIGYNPEATAAARVEVRGFLARHAAPGT